MKEIWDKHKGLRLCDLQRISENRRVFFLLLVVILHTFSGNMENLT